MKWIFRKDEDECKVFVEDLQGEMSEFSYIDMVGNLYREKEIQMPEFDGNFSDEEKESIIKLVNDINAHVANFFQKDE